ncbi:MAG: hypothetical protein U5L09_16635 [Bacteroidales bacterium]|nr:hypothetical protein [Bacteroidales bacterium]
MTLIREFATAIIIAVFTSGLYAQDDDLMSMLGDNEPETEFTYATFKKHAGDQRALGRESC